MSEVAPARTSSQADAYVAILTGGGDRPYALGLATALASERIRLDFVGSDDLEDLELRSNPFVRFLNLKGDQDPHAPIPRKVRRIISYYWKLVRYAATCEAKVFHVLWNNRFELIDRILLTAYYRLLGKRLVLTVHNVNAGARDGHDGLLNRMSLRVQYSLTHHLFVHTDGMKEELQRDFSVPGERISVIPFPVNTTVPSSGLTREDARVRLGLRPDEKVLLFFGRIVPYKGLHILVRAMALLTRRNSGWRLLIAGRRDDADEYWASVADEIQSHNLRQSVVQHIEHVPDSNVEVYFKAADVLVLPYTAVFQSGVLFLGYGFGLPAIVADVGPLRNEIEEGVTGFVCRPADPADLARAIDQYFASDLFASLDQRRASIRLATEAGHSWRTVAASTRRAYETLCPADALRH